MESGRSTCSGEANRTGFAQPVPSIYEQPDPKSAWTEVCRFIESLFGAQLQPPEFIKSAVKSPWPIRIAPVASSTCRAPARAAANPPAPRHLYANPKTVLLLDEPDAHLEVLRQRQI